MVAVLIGAKPVIRQSNPRIIPAMQFISASVSVVYFQGIVDHWAVYVIFAIENATWQESLVDRAGQYRVLLRP
jgi:hypothetical protein